MGVSPTEVLEQFCEKLLCEKIIVRIRIVVKESVYIFFFWEILRSMLSRIESY